MTQLSTQELATIRQHPQSTTPYLSIFRPRTILQCRVNDSGIQKGAISITFDSVTSGSPLNVENGMTAYIGSSLGAKDLGKIRVRSATATVLTVAENSEINWANDLYITVVRYFDIWPVYPRIIQDPANAEDVIFYKDYNIPYTNQNSVLGHIINMGSHRAGFIENGTYRAWWTSSGTYSLQTGTVPSYFWQFEGGTPTGSTQANPGWVSYDTPGHYVQRLIISGSNGAVDTSYRYVSVYNPISSGTNLPYLNWEMDSLSGSRDEGGYNTNIKIYQNSEEIEEGSVVVIWTDDWYGNTNQSFGGSQNNGKIFFVGYILDDTIRYDYESSTVDFQVASVTGYMKGMEGFSISVSSSDNPVDWTMILDMDIPKALYHYLRWQSTVLLSTDFEYRGVNPKLQYFDTNRESLYDSINSFLQSALQGKAVANRQGKIWAEPDAYLSITGTFPSTMELTKNDWMNEPTIDEQLVREKSYMERGGIQFSGAYTGTFAAFLACAPGQTPAYRGNTDTQEGLALLDQEHLNRITKNSFAFANNYVKSMSYPLAGNYRNIDIAPIEALHHIVNPEDTSRRIYINGDFNPVSMAWEYKADDNVMVASDVGFAPIVNGNLVEVINIPPLADEGGYNSPPIQVPNIPAMAIPAAFGAFLGITSIAYFESSSTVLSIEGGRQTLSFEPIYSTDNSIYRTGRAFFHVTSPGWYAFISNVGYGTNDALGEKNAEFTLFNQEGNQIEDRIWSFTPPASFIGSWGITSNLVAVFKIENTTNYVWYSASAMSNGSANEYASITVAKIREL